jgi:hypothetical protein
MKPVYLLCAWCDREIDSDVEEELSVIGERLCCQTCYETEIPHE